MKTIKLIAVSLLLSLVCSTAMADYAKDKGASEKAFDRASIESIFNRVGDWFATIGKSDSEKRTVLAERRANRAIKKMGKDAKKAKQTFSAKAKELKKKYFG